VRFALLGFIFLLILTLGNAWLMRQGAQFATAHDYAPLQLGQRRMGKIEWDMFVWREIAAVVVTVLVFGLIGAAARPSRSRSGSSSRPR